MNISIHNFSKKLFHDKLNTNCGAHSQSTATKYCLLYVRVVCNVSIIRFICWIPNRWEKKSRSRSCLKFPFGYRCLSNENNFSCLILAQSMTFNVLALNLLNVISFLVLLARNESMGKCLKKEYAGMKDRYW